MVAHAAVVNGAFPGTGNNERLRPTVLELKDQAFLQRMFDRLGSEEGRQILRGQQAKTRRDDGTLRLYQAVHRVFNVSLLEASCDRFGQPRLDGQKILSSGLVVRRVAKDGPEGWMHENGKVAGWKRLPGSMDGYDVEPSLRRQRRLGSNHRVLQQLAEYDSSAAFQEQSTSLFVAPPEVADGSGRTYVYGMIPLTSTERVEGEPPPAAPFSRDDIRTRLPALLQQGGNGRSGLPPTSTLISRSMRQDPAAGPLFRTLRYLTNECGLYTGAEGATQLRTVLSGINLSGSGSLGDFLQQAHDILLGSPEDPDNPPPAATQITTPSAWPSISAGVADNIVSAIDAAMQGRWAQMASPETRFQGLEHRYVLQCFIRVEGESGCPPKTLWTESTEPFEIVPWYEGGDAPPTVIELPDVTRDALQKLKPNVAFKVPESLQKIMDNLNVRGLMDGEEPTKSSWGFGMICSFSIPLITICAFIVLQIFIGLLNLAFWWSAFIRICIPFPKKN